MSGKLHLSAVVGIGVQQSFWVVYLDVNVSAHTHTKGVLSCPLAERYFSEKHDWSHEVWLPSCRAEPLTSDHSHLFSVGFCRQPVRSPAWNYTCIFEFFEQRTMFVRAHNIWSILLFIKLDELECWVYFHFIAHWGSRGPEPGKVSMIKSSLRSLY